MKKKRLIMTAALLSAFCMSAAGCSLYPGNKETQPANASQAETETKDETKQQPTGETEEETEKPTDTHPVKLSPVPLLNTGVPFTNWMPSGAADTNGLSIL